MHYTKNIYTYHFCCYQTGLTFLSKCNNMSVYCVTSYSATASVGKWYWGGNYFVWQGFFNFSFFWKNPRLVVVYIWLNEIGHSQSYFITSIYCTKTPILSAVFFNPYSICMVTNLKYVIIWEIASVWSCSHPITNKTLFKSTNGKVDLDFKSDKYQLKLAASSSLQGLI